MNFIVATRLAIGVLGIAGLLVAGTLTTRDATPSASDAPAVNSKEVTGQHRGYSNDNLFLRLDSEKEMTFVVAIPGDKDWKWHNQFKTLSRITVTYHQGPTDKVPVATAIRNAAK